MLLPLCQLSDIFTRFQKEAEQEEEQLSMSSGTWPWPET